MSAVAIRPLQADDEGARPGRRRVERAPLPAGASLVETVPYRLTQRLLREVLGHRGCLEVSGPGGCGKTFAVDAHFERAEVDVVKVHLYAAVHGYGFVRRLIAELGGDPVGDAEGLMAALREAVGTRRVYVYVDEADNLNTDSLRVIRYLRDQRDLWIAFVLVGSSFQKAYRRVPELDTRVTRRVNFAPLAGRALADTLAAYHPFLATAEPDLIRRIDAEHCKGNWRSWSTMLETLLEYAARVGETALTPQLAAAALGVTVDVARAARGTRARRSHLVAGR